MYPGFFCFRGFFFAELPALLLPLLLGAEEGSGTGAENDLAPLNPVTGRPGLLPDRKHIADAEASYIVSSVPSLATPMREVVELSGPWCNGLMKTLKSWGGVGGGSSTGSMFISHGGRLWEILLSILPNEELLESLAGRSAARRSTTFLPEDFGGMDDPVVVIRGVSSSSSDDGSGVNGESEKQ